MKHLHLVLFLLACGLLSFQRVFASTGVQRQDSTQGSFVRIQLEGKLDRFQQARAAITFQTSDNKQRVEVEASFPRGATGAEFLALLLDHLEHAGVDVTRVPNREDVLLVHSVIEVAFDVGGGWSLGLCASDAIPSVRLTGSDPGPKSGSRVTLSGGIRSGRKLGSGAYRIMTGLDGDLDAPSCAARFLGKALESGVLSEKPGGDSWRPVRMSDGQQLQGLALELNTGDASAWRVEFSL